MLMSEITKVSNFNRPIYNHILEEYIWGIFYILKQYCNLK